MSTASYDAWHADLAAREDLPTPTAPWHQLAKKHLGRIDHLNVLEIGCGRGAFAGYLVEQGANVIAADFSPEAVMHAKRVVRGHADVLVADIQRIPFSDAAFDLVVSLETLEHVPNPRKGLAELVRVTKPGGRLIVTTPNYLSLIGLYRVGLRLVGRRFQELGQPINQPLTLYGRVRQLRRLGCRVDAVDSCGQLLPVPGYKTVELPWLEHPQRLMRWVMLHGLTAATRLP